MFRENLNFHGNIASTKCSLHNFPRFCIEILTCEVNMFPFLLA